MKPVGQRRLHAALHLGAASAGIALINQPAPDTALLILGAALLIAQAWTLWPLWPTLRGQEVPFTPDAAEVKQACLSVATLGGASGAAHLIWGVGGHEMPGLIQFVALMCAGSGILAVPISLWQLRR